MADSQDALLATAEERVDDALRAVASYHELDYELQYLRDDIAESYSEEEIGEVIQELVLGGLSREYLEKIFHAGRIECTVFGFEEAAMFRFVRNGHAGRLVTVDRDVELNLDEFIGACKAAIDG